MSELIMTGFITVCLEPRRLDLIEKWGNGLKLIHKELKNYPEIKFIWLEPGISFRVAFEITTQETTSKMAAKTLRLLSENPKITAIELTESIGEITFERVMYHLKKLIKLGRIEHIGPTKDGYWRIIK